MANRLSPGIDVYEFDVTTAIPSVSTSMGALAGIFRWGPVYEAIVVDSENDVVNRFLPPTNLNAETFFVLASYLAYAKAATVVRCANVTSSDANIAALTAVANISSISNVVSCIVPNHDAYVTMDGTFEAGALFLAKWPGAAGNSLRLSVCYDEDSYKSSVNLANYGLGATLSMNVGSNSALITVEGDSAANANVAATSLKSEFAVADLLELGSLGPNGIGQQHLKITDIGNITVAGNNATFTISTQQFLQLHDDVSVSTSINRYWEFFSAIGQAPGQSQYQLEHGNTSVNDEMHIVVVDDGGVFTGVPGTILETYRGVSRATDGRTFDGQTNYYKDIINKQSQFIWFANHNTDAPANTALLLTNSSVTAPLNIRFQGGSDGASEANTSPAVIMKGYDLFQNKEDILVDLVMTGKAIGGIGGTQLPNYILDNITGKRKDCVAYVSPDYGDVVNNPGLERNAIIDFKNNSRSTSYGFMETGYKYMYDRYNNIYRYVPMNGDMAGLAAQTDLTNDAWWSPAGFNRGHIKNIVRLAYSPREADRDLLYPNGINPVVSFKGQGTILYGDRTMLVKPSAFDRINVRRLFIVLERAIAIAAQYSLFEFNDTFTRSQFKNMVNPYLRDIKGRRGITDFLVVCDETNNTPVVIDRNEFIGDIYIKPSRSINFIKLNFVAVPTGVSFTEIVGNFGGS